MFGVQTTQQEPVDPSLSRLRQIDNVASSGTPALAESLLNKINNAESMDELMQLIYSE